MTITRLLTRAAVMLLLALLSTTSWAELVQDAEGYYLIGTDAEWTEFANGINDGTIAAATNVKLMADITATTMIGSFSGGFNTSKLYSGIFDGNHHTITANINNSSANYVALISCIRNATIKDLTVTGSISGGQHCSGLVSVADGTNTISNVSISATITGSNSHCAGVLGHSYSSVTTINGCIFTGTINGRSSGSTIGVFNGWSNSTGVSINNCVEAGTYTNNSNFNPIAFSGLTSYSNNYFVTPAKNSNYVYGTQMSTSIPDNDVYGQLTVAGNTYYIPTVVSGIGDIYELIDDPITPEPIVTYIGNSLTKVTDYTVSYSNNDAVGTATVTITGAGEFSGEKNINFIIYSSDYALIGTAEQLKNFATLVNSGVTNAKGKLIADIDLAGDDDNQWTPIGTDANKYNGTFDGQGFTIKNLYYKQQVEGVGLFGFANSGAYIKNVRVEGTVDNSTNGAGAGNGGTQTCAGGIIGKSYEATVLNCSFSGNVISYSNIGGLVGWGTATIVNCYNEGTVMFHSTANQTGGGVHGYGGSPQLKNCYNVGSVINNGSASYAIGSLSVSGSVSNSYSRSGCVQNGSGASWINAGNTGTVMSLEDMKSEAFVTTLNTNIASLRTTYPDISEWTQDPITNQPVLKIFASLTQDENGYYLLGSVQDWKNFAELVNTTPTANAKMTADIDLGDDQTMVGTYAVKYQGTFDGQGHTLTINYNTSSMTIEPPQQFLGAAPFRDIQNATIRNLHTAGTVTADKIGATGLVGWAYGENTIERCWSSVDIVSSNNTADTFSGFVFRQDGSLLTMNDCYYSGMIQSERKLSHAGFVGHHNAGTAVLNNCLVIFADGTDVPATPPDAGYKCYTFVRNQDKTPIINLSNCYYKTALGTVQGTQATTEQLADGTVAYKLQAGRTDMVWGQRIGIDIVPVQTNDESYRVYRSINGGYTNDPTLAYEGLQQDGDGNYLIGSVLDWQDFADLIRTAPTANAKMTADIDLGDDQTMVGTENNKYQGTFDGQGHKLTIAYNVTENNAAPFRFVSGANIRNLHVDGTINTTQQFAGGVVARAVTSVTSISNCWSSVNIIGTYNEGSGGDTDFHGGLVAIAINASTTIDLVHLNDCLFTGSIKGGDATRSHCANFIGLQEYANSTIMNCLSTATYTDQKQFNASYHWYYGGGTVSNALFLNANYTSGNGGRGTQISTEQLADGTATATLNAGRTGDDALWVQDPITNQPVLKIFASLTQDENGYYLLGSVQDWDNFATLVQTTPTANAKMTADIDLGDDQTMVGTYAVKYQGTFDGQGHTLTINYNTSGMTIESGQSYLGAAPFRDIQNATIRNLHTAGTVTADKIGATGLVGWAYGENTIERCWSSVDIVSSNNTADTFSGFVFRQDGSLLTMNDCYYSGMIQSEKKWSHAGFVGHHTTGTAVLNNCLVIFADGTDVPASTQPGSKCYTFVRDQDQGKIINLNYCYYKTAFGTVQGTQATTEELANGTTAAALQNGRSEVIWVQDPVTNQPMLKLFANPISFIHDGNWDVASNWNTGAVPAAGSDVTIAAAATIQQTCIANVGHITIADGGSLTVDDGGQLIHSGSVYATVKKDILGHEGNNNSGWNFIATPIAAGTTPSTINGIEDVPLEDYDLYYYDEPAKYWRNHKLNNINILYNGQGYLYAHRTAKELTFEGVLQAGESNGTYTVRELSHAASSPLTGFNLVGNPFACNATVNRSCYSIQTENGKQVVKATTSTTLGPCEGVMVQVAENDDEVTFTKVIPATQGAPANPGSLQIALTETNTRGNAMLDNAIVIFNEGEQLGKFYFGSQNANIYIPQGNKDYAIAFSEGQGEMPLNFKANENGIYTISVKPEGVEMSYLHLIDNLTGANIDLMATSDYTFTAKTTDYASRFRLVFSANDGTSTGSGTFAFFDGSVWVINNEGRATLQVIDIMGRVISTETINGDANVNVNEAAGVYMLRLINGDNVKVQKVVVR